MTGPKVYTLAEAAKLAGTTEDELRCAIQDGMLPGTLLQNVGTYQVRHEDLLRYLKSKGRRKLTNSGRKKVLIIDDEINFANIMKIELERDPRIEAKFATWGRDGVKLAKEFQPDLCLIDFMLPDITGDEVLASIREVKGLKNAHVLVYSAHTREAIRKNPNLETRLQSMGANDFISKSGGMRPLIVRVYELLGLDTQTKIIRKL
jgi:CheY-like chemotaxis protein